MVPDRPPLVPLDLIEWLTSLYPNRVPDLTDTDREVWFHAGQASVVARLRQQFEEQAQRDLEDT